MPISERFRPASDIDQCPAATLVNLPLAKYSAGELRLQSLRARMVPAADVYAAPGGQQHARLVER